MFDRERERAELATLLSDGEPRLVLLYGRRRVGKTYLLTNVWPPDQTFYFTAANTTPAQNRLALVAEIARWSAQPLDPGDYPTWRTIFRLLLELRAPAPIAIVLDEFQYLGGSEQDLAAVASELNAVWEQRRTKRPLVLALSGSAIRTMEALAAGAAPLYGRFQWRAELHPFDYFHAGEMAKFRSPRDRAIAYGVFGGIPRYLAAVRPGRSLAQNVAETMLHPRGEVRAQVETALLQEQGLRDVASYHALLRAIADGRTELNEIGQRAGLPTDTALRLKVERLVALGYVEAHRNLGAKAKEAYRYRLADPAQMFHATFVAPFEAELARYSPAAVWKEQVLPKLDTYMGHVFERMAEQAYTRLQAKWRLPMVSEWGRWEGVDRQGKSLEIDIASRLSDGRMLTGAIKWNRRPISADVHRDHLAMLERLAAAGVKWARPALEPDAPLLYIAAGGFAPGFEATAKASGHPVVLWSLRELYGSGSGRAKQAAAKA
jgi:AAA+ ATPase superfamily predicted ATPase